MIAANTCKPTVMYFNYPSGGKAKKIVGGSLAEPIGTAVSLK